MPTQSRPGARPSRAITPDRPRPYRTSKRSDKPLLFNFDPTLSKAERDQRRTQWAVLVTVIIVGVALLIAAIGFYVNGIRQPGLPVATVDGHVIRRDTWQHYQALITDEIQAQGAQLQAQPAAGDAAAAQQAELQALQQELQNVGDTAVNDMINAQVIAASIPQLEKDGAPADKIVASQQQIDAAQTKEEQMLGIGGGGDLQQFLKSVGLSQDEFKNILATRVEADNIKAYLSRDIQPVQPQVKARIMTFGDASKADAALKELRGGSSWDSVNLKYAQDPAAKQTSRDVDWTPKGQEDSTFDQFAFGAQPFQISDVLQDNGSYEIVQVEDVAPARPLTPTQTDAVKAKTYNDWLTKQTAAAQIHRYPENMSGAASPAGGSPAS